MKLSIIALVVFSMGLAACGGGSGQICILAICIQNNANQDSHDNSSNTSSNTADSNNTSGSHNGSPWNSNNNGSVVGDGSPSNNDGPGIGPIFSSSDPANCPVGVSCMVIGPVTVTENPDSPYSHEEFGDLLKELASIDGPKARATYIVASLIKDYPDIEKAHELLETIFLSKFVDEKGQSVDILKMMYETFIQPQTKDANK